jgi:hypothetical protein
MGQYHRVYNLDKKEMVSGRGLEGGGVKLLEQVGFLKSTADAVFLLISNSNGRGGGDADEHPMVGRWAGDRIVLQGDYADPGDPGFVTPEQRGEFTDVSSQVKVMLDVAMARY